VARVGAALGIAAVPAAAAILRVANSNMERAIRVVSVERGEDPRDFPLVAFGGCGGLHACEIAAELGIATVIAPRMAGALSALGMLLADRTRDYSAGALGQTDWETRLRKLEKQARKDVPGARLERFADVRYQGQSYELTIPWQGDFHKEHRRVYGYSDEARPTQIVTLRVRATLPVKKPVLTAPRSRAVSFASMPLRRVWTGRRWQRIPAAPREAIGPKTLPGPALITDYGATTLVPQGWQMRSDAAGTLVLTRL
jgi:N-methylhydantoinase A